MPHETESLVPASRRKMSDEDRLAEEYEDSLVSPLDDATLRKVFAGLVERR